VAVLAHHDSHHLPFGHAVALRHEAGDAERAERAMRKIMQDSRNEVMRQMSQSHGEAIEPFRLQTI